jgi:hypothetical protein
MCGYEPSWGCIASWSLPLALSEFGLVTSVPMAVAQWVSDQAPKTRTIRGGWHAARFHSPCRLVNSRARGREKE